MLKLCAPGEPEDEFAVSFEEVVIGEEVGVLPEDLLEFVIDGDASELGDAVEDQIDGGTLAVAELIALEFCSDDGFDAELFAEFAGQGFFWSFAGIDFTAGEFPLEAVPIVAPALTNQHFSGMSDDACHHGYNFCHCFP